MFGGVQFVEGFNDGITDIARVAEVIVGEARTLDVFPDVFDVVEFGTVRGEPENSERGLKLAQILSNDVSRMVAGVVHNQQAVTSPVLDRQLGEERQELGGVLVLTDPVRDLVAPVIQGSKDRNPLVRARSRHGDSLVFGHPHPHEMRVEMSLALVQKEEFYSGTWFQGLFFR